MMETNWLWVTLVLIITVKRDVAYFNQKEAKGRFV